jgi:type IV pilus assembly protein PilX
MTQLPTSQHMKTRSASDAGTSMSIPSRQSGIALIVSLLLLIVITLVGLAAIHGTITQQQMAANFYDRQVAMQGAEAAIRAAQSIVQANPASTFIRDCSPTAATACEGNPFTDANVPSTAIQTVATGTAAGQFTKSAVAASQPQFVVQNMGAFQDPNANTNYNQTANSYQYGGTAGALTYTYYRITARSGDPSTIGDRSVVTLQAMIKQ